MPVDIIVLAAVAIFVLLRLYGVLGQNIGHHDDRPQERDATFDNDSKVIELTPRQIEHMAEMQPEAPEEDNGGLPDAIQQGIAQIREQERDFRMREFLEGARIAFEMVLEAFNKDDRDTLKSLLDKPVYDAFAQTLRERSEQESYTETTLVSILEAEPLTVEVDGKHAIISVRFVTEQVQVSRARGGEQVKDSASTVEQVEDVWRFARTLRSANPNWKVTAT